MIYVVADIHGCREAFHKLLESIHFSDEDELYVLGDMIDRGEDSIGLLLDLMGYSNIYPLMGNHEYMALNVLDRLDSEISDELLDNLTERDLIAYNFWMENGGDSTLKQYLRLDYDTRRDILDYLHECSLCEVVEVGNKQFVLVHAGFFPFDEKKSLGKYKDYELLFTSPDYDKRYFSDAFLVTGHTPTMAINDDHSARVFKKNGHIAIDCGCVFGGKLAAYCLDTGKEFYIEKRL